MQNKWMARFMRLIDTFIDKLNLLDPQWYGFWKLALFFVREAFP
jgi:hypothetical protein